MESANRDNRTVPFLRADELVSERQATGQGSNALTSGVFHKVRCNKYKNLNTVPIVY